MINSQAFHFHTPDEQCNLVLAKGRWCSVTGKVCYSTGHASQPPTGTEMSTQWSRVRLSCTKRWQVKELTFQKISLQVGTLEALNWGVQIIAMCIWFLFIFISFFILCRQERMVLVVVDLVHLRWWRVDQWTSVRWILPAHRCHHVTRVVASTSCFSASNHSYKVGEECMIAGVFCLYAWYLKKLPRVGSGTCGFLLE